MPMVSDTCLSKPAVYATAVLSFMGGRVRLYRWPNYKLAYIYQVGRSWCNTAAGCVRGVPHPTPEKIGALRLGPGRMGHIFAGPF
jgi:hypothetical protein